ncbi:Na+/H+ antiporter family protein [Parendozoicomonas haliclonae]|uniref:Na+/H+ antiporter family protein n=1 Tax=Parendozoicomonas haliclonae TaxID=1960125 RepID=A0A1X7AFT1_9GAMM|nr:Na+/H+ antiporter NhaC family protein [Parendozoicomonas haliclonae]SMA37033.1 Na+/H+ antiporter family protein [Parendozoicomonas haliclonae]
MNAVVIAVLVMLVLSLARVNVVLALLLGALAGGLTSELGLAGSVTAFSAGIGNGASIGLSYAMLGAFAMGIAKSGIPEFLAQKIITMVQKSHHNRNLAKASILIAVLLMAVASQNLIPVHIAFIPILIPPLLGLFNSLQLDRRLIACFLTFGLTATYMLLPVGFGNIFLTEILARNLNDNSLEISSSLMPQAMIIPVAGMFLGLLVAVFWTYRKPCGYADSSIQSSRKEPLEISGKTLFGTLLAVVLTLAAQLYSGSMIIGALSGCATLMFTGVLKWKESNDTFVQGMKMMAYAGFIMIAAAGFAEVMRQTNAIPDLVQSASSLFGDSKAMAVFLMLITGLLITLGIGSSFSTVPVIATLFVPLGMEFGLSALAIATLVGTAGALGDAGSPASDSTIGPTAGLNADGQHDHIRGSVLPTFLHFNIPLIIFGWGAVMIL